MMCHGAGKVLSIVVQSSIHREGGRGRAREGGKEREGEREREREIFIISSFPQASPHPRVAWYDPSFSQSLST